MYIHIVPKLYHLMADKCSLKSISIPELDFIIVDLPLYFQTPVIT